VRASRESKVKPTAAYLVELFHVSVWHQLSVRGVACGQPAGQARACQ
jgi:hypothetical protein